MTISPIENISGIRLGILGTHLGFIDALVPGEDGSLPRNADGDLVVFAGARDLCDRSPVKIDAIQISSFGGSKTEDVDELITNLKSLGLEAQLVMMVGGVNPMNPDDEDGTVEQLLGHIDTAKRHGITQVNSTSIEAWLEGAPPKSEEEFQARVAQNIKVHHRVYQEGDLANSGIDNWNIEFLRPGEFHNFTSLAKLQPVLEGLKAETGTSFFKALIDAAHCGDSGLSIPENEALIAAYGDNDFIGPFHCSAPTTRGCLTTDDGWIGALLAANAKTGKLPSAFVELFKHDDPALEPLRTLDPRHGVDTTGGRSYPELMVDGLIDTVRRLNNFKARGIV